MVSKIRRGKIRNKKEKKLEGEKCPRCGNDNPPGSKYCQNCEVALEDEIKQSVKPKRHNIQSKIDSTSNGKSFIGKSFIRKIPGFRSKTGWKMIFSSLVYLILVIIIISGVSSVFSNNDDNVEVLVNNIEVTAHSFDKESEYPNVTLTIRNNGTSEIPYVPVDVKFYDSWGNPDGGDSSIVINMKPDEEKNFTVEGRSSTIASYKIIVGDPETCVDEEDFANAFEPLLKSYNSSKGPETSSITAIGALINTDNSTSSGLNNTSVWPFAIGNNATIFLNINEGEEFVGTWVYRDSGQTISGYKQYKDIVVIYWPEMKVAGWHRVYGPNPPETATGEYEYIIGDEPDVQAWINSLPRQE